VFDCVITVQPRQKPEAIIMQATRLEATLDPALVQLKAYEIWQSSGCPEGAADRNWFEAERQLKSGSAEVTPAREVDRNASSATAKADSAPPESGPVIHDESSSPFASADQSANGSKTKKTASHPRRSSRR
jgi:hypothetical protein